MEMISSRCLLSLYDSLAISLLVGVRRDKKKSERTSEKKKGCRERNRTTQKRHSLRQDNLLTCDCVAALARVVAGFASRGF